ncbi:MAG: hypothetical protein ABSD79_04135 [Dehalococcoidales bacterium]
MGSGAREHAIAWKLLEP